MTAAKPLTPEEIADRILNNRESFAVDEQRILARGFDAERAARAGAEYRSATVQYGLEDATAKQIAEWYFREGWKLDTDAIGHAIERGEWRR